MPGTDHAGIATQTVVEKRLLADGVKRLEMGREAFVATTQELEGRVRAGHHRSARRDGRLVRLRSHPLHDGRDVRHGGATRVLHALRRRPDLPRQAARQLGSGDPHGALRRRGRERRGRRPHVVPRVPARRRLRPRHRRHDATRDDARRHRGRRQSERPARRGTRRHERSSCRSSAARSRSSPTTTS